MLSMLSTVLDRIEIYLLTTDVTFYVRNLIRFAGNIIVMMCAVDWQNFVARIKYEATLNWMDVRLHDVLVYSTPSASTPPLFISIT